MDGYLVSLHIICTVVVEPESVSILLCVHGDGARKFTGDRNRSEHTKKISGLAMIAQVKDSHTAADILVCSLLLLNVLSNKKEAVFIASFPSRRLQETLYGKIAFIVVSIWRLN